MTTRICGGHRVSGYPDKNGLVSPQSRTAAVRSSTLESEGSIASYSYSARVRNFTAYGLPYLLCNDPRVYKISPQTPKQHQLPT